MPRISAGRAAFLAAALGQAALLSACVQPKPAEQALLVPVQYADLPGWSADRPSEALPAIQASCRRLAALPATTELGGQSTTTPRGSGASDWLPACHDLQQLEPGQDARIRATLEAWLVPYRVTAPGFFTGYYEPEVAGALTRGGDYQTKLLARPNDLMQGPPPASDPNGPPTIGRLADGRILPYWTRRQIEAGAADRSARTLFWLRSPIDLFFLQVQGAGRVRLPDGSVLRLAFDGKNGQPYTPIGRVLEQRHALAPEQVTMQTIRAWLEAHPTDAKSVMDANEDYVFFRVVTDQDEAGDAAGAGPPGAFGVHLTAGRSAAIDRHFIPLGAPLFLDTQDPLTRKPWQRLVLAQDLGSDIKGAGRTDIFMGNGDTAGLLAGAMRQHGTEYVLLPRPPAGGR